jgi:hypothetical protein
MNLLCIHRKRCYEFKEAVAIAMGDSVNEENNISQIQAEVRVISEYCSKCKRLTESNNDEKRNNRQN